MIEAELHDGTVLEFPDGTPDHVVQGAVKRQLGTPAAPSPEPSAPAAEPTRLGQWAERAAQPEQGAEPALSLGHLFPLAEPVAHLASGAATMPAAGLAGIAREVAGMKEIADTGRTTGPSGAETVAQVSEAGTYQPKTRLGQAATEVVSTPLRWLSEISDFLGGKTAEATGSPVAGAILNAAAQTFGAPAILKAGAGAAAVAGLPFAARAAKAAAPVVETSPAEQLRAVRPPEAPADVLPAEAPPESIPNASAQAPAAERPAASVPAASPEVPAPEAPVAAATDLAAGAERRRPEAAALRQRVADMAPEDMRQALLTDHMTGLQNRRAYDEAQKQPAQVSIDLDALKWINDNLGHGAGDEIIRAMGTAIAEETGKTGRGYHLSGDEFAIEAGTPEEAAGIVHAVRDRLSQAELTFQLPDGRTVTKKGVDFSHGIGPTLEAADSALRGNKVEREAAGARAPRGETPAGVTFGPAEGQPVDLGKAPAQAVVPARAGAGTLGMNRALDPEVIKQAASEVANSDVVKAGRQAVSEFANDIQLKAAPMALGTDRARAIAKDYANAERVSRYQWSQFDDILKKNYDPAQRKKMWEAADEENILREMNVPEAERAGRGIARLTPDERATLGTLHQYGEGLLERARAAGLFKGEGLKYWSPRVVMMMGEDGTLSSPKAAGEGGGSPYSSPSGRNITTSAPSLRERKYLTTEETEAAAKAKFGAGAQVVRDIRTMPFAMGRLERAIAGRELINGIRDVGKRTGQELVSGGAKEGYFTLDHPAFKTFRPKFVEEGGKMKPALDQNGQMIFERSPVYVSKEFEGPLKAVMSDTPGKLYEAMMALKAKTMGLIMYSPLIHNAVEWGRALPVMPGKILTFRVYFEGNAAKRDPVQMREAIGNGMVPIGNRFQHQDISGVLEEPNLAPGRSITAKVLGGAVGLASKGAGEAVKRGIDVAGDFWHNTLLWDRIGDLQMGLYTNIQRDLIAKGTDPGTAGKIAAHFANRYAGALPNEAMSSAVRKAANFVLFSRTFTLGNLGVMKDMITGLPRDVRAQIARDAGEAAAYAAKGIAQRKAIQAFAMDIALMYVGNASLQGAFDVMKRDQSLDDVGRGYAERYDRLAKRVHEQPSELLNPFLALDQLSPGAENEPGKERRVLYGYDDKGTAIYLRVPTGKIGEEFVDWTTSPLDILKRKEGTIMRPLVQTLTNDKGFGRQVYNPDEPGFKGAAKAVGNILANILKQQFPVEAIESAANLARGRSDDIDAYKVIGPFFGLTFSQGAPGGPEVGQMFAVERRHRAEISEAMPDIKKRLKAGEVDEAVTLMQEAHMTPAEMRMTFKFAEQPSARMTPRRLQKFSATATDEERDRIARLAEQSAAQRERNLSATRRLLQ